MSYNLSPNAYNQVKEILDELLDLKVGGIWKQSFADNNKAARLIRQGFEYCKVNEKDVGKRLAELKQNIRIRVTNDCVIAERKFNALERKAVVAPVRGMTFMDETNLNGVVTAFLKNQQLTTMLFPNAKLNESELAQLNKVVSMNDYVAGFAPNNELGIIKNAESRTTKEHTD